VIGALTVARKELLELLGERHSMRGVLVQAAGTVLTTGVLVPAMDGQVWSNPAALAMIYFVFPCMVAASVAADAFAGERERKTLETLLATPLRDADILVGKVTGAVSFATGISALSLFAAVLTANVSGRMPAPFIPAAEIPLALLGGTIGASLITSALAIFASTKVHVARAVQQMVPLLTMAVVLAINVILAQLGVQITWMALLRIDLVLLLLGATAVALSAGVFRRSKMFENK
jgi:ABC-2 type transport system permease protein